MNIFATENLLKLMSGVLLSIFLTPVTSFGSGSVLCERALLEVPADAVKANDPASTKTAPEIKSINDEFQPSQIFRAVKGDLNMSFRGSNGHFWEQLSQADHLKRFFILGPVMGDLHPGNISIMVNGKKVTFGLIDPDDAGHGALIGDFLHLQVSRKIITDDFDFNHSIELYQKGLQGQAPQMPHWMKKDIEDAVNSLDKDQQKQIDKYTANGKFNAKADLTDITQAPATAQKIWKLAKDDILKSVKGTVLDFGYKAKDEGGSQEYPRFWLLVKNPGGNLVIAEFKFETDSSVKFFHPNQQTFALRFQQAMKFYSDDFNPAFKNYAALQVGDLSFYLRERQGIDFTLDTEKSKFSKDEIVEMYDYLFQWTGYRQSQTPSAKPLSAELDKQDFSDLQDFLKDYFSLIKKLTP